MDFGWGGADWFNDRPNAINPNNGYSHYLIFSNYSTREINENFINNKTPALNCKTLAELVGKLKGVMVRIGPDALELIDSQNENQKGRSQNENPDTRKNNYKEPTDQNLKDMGITREEFELLNTAFTDPAHLANILKKLAHSPPEKMAEMLNRMYNHIMPKTADAMFKQMVDHNPVFNDQEKQKLKETWDQAKTKEDKKKV